MGAHLWRPSCMGGWLVEREGQRLDGTVIIEQATGGGFGGRFVSDKINCLEYYVSFLKKL